jgi:hypothetical protein
MRAHPDFQKIRGFTERIKNIVYTRLPLRHHFEIR